MTESSCPTRTCLHSTEIPKNRADDFENDRYTSEYKPTPLVGFGFKSCTNLPQRRVNIGKTLKKEKPMLIKLPYGTVIYVLSFRFTRQSRQVILGN